MFQLEDVSDLIYLYENTSLICITEGSVSKRGDLVFLFTFTITNGFLLEIQCFYSIKHS